MPRLLVKLVGRPSAVLSVGVGRHRQVEDPSVVPGHGSARSLHATGPDHRPAGLGILGGIIRDGAVYTFTVASWPRRLGRATGIFAWRWLGRGSLRFPLPGVSPFLFRFGLDRAGRDPALAAAGRPTHSRHLRGRVSGIFRCAGAAVHRVPIPRRELAIRAHSGGDSTNCGVGCRRERCQGTRCSSANTPPQLK